LFLTVFELPKDSKTGFVSKIFYSIGTSVETLEADLLFDPRPVRNFIARFAFSVFPEPDSPLMTMA
jgi:hypothetical protein